MATAGDGATTNITGNPRRTRTMNIKEKLDALAEYHAQKDMLSITKGELLSEVRIPDEVMAIMDQANALMRQIEKDRQEGMAVLEKEAQDKLQLITIPEEIKQALEAIDQQRRKVEEARQQNEKYLNGVMASKREQIEAQTQALTKGVYDEVAQRRRDIEAEFSGKTEDVDTNIKALEAEIKAEVVAGKKTVKGKFFQAVYVKGRVTWNTDKMEAWMNDHPFLAAARKEGEPSVTLRKV